MLTWPLGRFVQYQQPGDAPALRNATEDDVVAALAGSYVEDICCDVREPTGSKRPIRGRFAGPRCFLEAASHLAVRLQPDGSAIDGALEAGCE